MRLDDGEGSIDAGPSPVTDPINPSYYKRGGFEVADIIEAFDLNWRLGSAVKYILRAGKKGDRLEDLRKSMWYLAREIESASKATN